jgi:hypothetical protein
MNTDLLFSRRNRTLIHHQSGQSMVEFALILPLFVLIVVGIFDLGRAFFAFIAISNAAREGARVYTFSPDITTIQNIETAVTTEIGSSPMVDVGKIVFPIQIECGSSYHDVPAEIDLEDCPAGQPIRVTVTYNFDLLISLLFPKPLTLKRSAEMMVPWIK